MKHLNADDVLKSLSQFNAKRSYKVMYSSLYQGVVTDPELMLLPIDDHMVHRGDGVFEAIRVTAKQIYLLKPHIERLFKSADFISLNHQYSLQQVLDLCQQVTDVARGLPSGYSDGVLRVFLSRGPGDFSPNPYTTLGTQIYIVATSFNAIPKEKYEVGVSLGFSSVPVKPSFYSQVKSCNYLPNVMMKKESVDRGVDFVINLTDDGFIAEGPTENILMVSAQGDLCAPRFDYTLAGTTLKRALWFAEQKYQKKARLKDISREELEAAKEIMMVGTTLSVLPVTRLEGQPIGNGLVGEIARDLNAKIQLDMNS